MRDVRVCMLSCLCRGPRQDCVGISGNSIDRGLSTSLLRSSAFSAPDTFIAAVCALPAVNALERALKVARASLGSDANVVLQVRRCAARFCCLFPLCSCVGCAVCGSSQAVVSVHAALSWPCCPMSSSILLQALFDVSERVLRMRLLGKSGDWGGAYVAACSQALESAVDILRTFVVEVDGGNATTLLTEEAQDLYVEVGAALLEECDAFGLVSERLRSAGAVALAIDEALSTMDETELSAATETAHRLALTPALCELLASPRTDASMQGQNVAAGASLPARIAAAETAHSELRRLNAALVDALRRLDVSALDTAVKLALSVFGSVPLSPLASNAASLLHQLQQTQASAKFALETQDALQAGAVLDRAKQLERSVSELTATLPQASSDGVVGCSVLTPALQTELRRLLSANPVAAKLAEVPTASSSPTSLVPVSLSPSAIASIASSPRPVSAAVLTRYRKAQHAVVGVVHSLLSRNDHLARSLA